MSARSPPACPPFAWAARAAYENLTQRAGSNCPVGVPCPALPCPGLACRFAASTTHRARPGTAVRPPSPSAPSSADRPGWHYRPWRGCRRCSGTVAARPCRRCFDSCRPAASLRRPRWLPCPSPTFRCRRSASFGTVAAPWWAFPAADSLIAIRTSPNSSSGSDRHCIDAPGPVHPHSTRKQRGGFFSS